MVEISLSINFPTWRIDFSPAEKCCQWWRGIFFPSSLRLSRRIDKKHTLGDMARSMSANDTEQKEVVWEIVRGGNYGWDSFWAVE